LKNLDKNNDVLWQEARDFSDPSQVHEVQLPTSILDLKAVSREINFSTIEELKNFRIVHTAKFKGRPLEQMNYTMGTVKAGTSNTWISTIEAAPESVMMPAKILNGNVTIETEFYDDSEKFATSIIKLFYV
jgi:retinal rod rhodopsin-sensitive cGMP 3',5'-cyclic phosphodiesterase subunit delta